MPSETPKLELSRLLKEQQKARNDEIFLGFSQAERAQFEARGRRIHALQSELIGQSDAVATRQRDWEKASETDTPQATARQPYRSREKDSSRAYSDSEKNRRELEPKEESE